MRCSGIAGDGISQCERENCQVPLGSGKGVSVLTKPEPENESPMTSAPETELRCAPSTS